MATWSWENLPLDLLKSVLLRVDSVRDLCRYRAVCKAWNHVITQPKFGFLHATSAPRAECYILTAPRKVTKPVTYSRRARSSFEIAESETWQLLDLATKRMCSIPDTFVREGLAQLFGAAGALRLSKFTLAATGGLIYAEYRSSDTTKRVPPRYVVCNPVSKTFHQILEPPFGIRGENAFNVIAMFVEAATQRYRIVLMESMPFHAQLRPEVYLYDSWVRVWRMLCYTPGVQHWPSSSVVLDGIFYTLFEDLEIRRYKLHSCDLETGAWRLIDVPLPQSPPFSVLRSRSQVVAAAGRLFFVTNSGPVGSHAAVLVTIWKNTPGELGVNAVARLPMLWKYNLVHLWTCPIVAIGCGDSIIVSFFDGRRVRWDAVRNTWYGMAPFMPNSPTGDFHSFFVGSFHLQMQQMLPD